MNPHAPSHHHRLGRVLTWVAAIIGSVAALIVLAVIGAYFGLQTRAGGRLLKSIAVGQVNKSIRGHLALGTVAFHGTGLDLRDVVLTDPEDLPVIRVGHLSVRYGLWGLFSRQVEINSVDIDRPEIYLRQDVRGLNVSRAIEPREPKVAEPSKPESAPGKGWQVNLVRFWIGDGAVEFKSPPSSPAAPGHEVRVGGLGLLAAGRVQTATRDGEFHLQLNGVVDGAGGLSRAPLAVGVHVAAGRGIPRGEARVSLGDLIALVATVASDRNGELEIRKLKIPPSLALAFLPSWPVRIPLQLSGMVRIEGEIASTDLIVRGEGAAGNLTVKADGNLSGTYTPHGIQVEARDLRLSDFVVRVPVTAPLAISIRVAPGSLLVQEAVARAKIDVPRTIFAGHGFGPLHLDVATTAGMLERLTLRLPLPGALLTAEGESRPDGTVVTTRLLASRLGSLRTAAVALGAGSLPKLDGSASVEIVASGPARLYPRSISTGSQAVAEAGWTLVANAAAPVVRVGASRFRGIAVRATVPELLSDRQAVNVTASLKAPLRIAVNLSASAKETKRIPPRVPGNDLGGESRGSQRTDVELERLAIDYPGSRWATRGPAHFVLETEDGATPDSRLTVAGLALYAGAQKIAADVRRDSKSLTADLQIKALRIQDLPGIRAVGVKISGLVDASVHAGGSPEKPRVDAKLTLREGRADKFKGLTADVSATLLDNRTIGGRVAVGAGRLGNLAAQFKGPATSPPPPNAPIAATIDVRNVELGNLPLPPGVRVKADGSMQAHLEIRGTVGDPRLSVRVAGQRVTIQYLPSPGSMVVQGGQGGVGEPDADAPVPPFKVESIVIEGSYASPKLEAKVALVDDHQGSLHASGSSRAPVAELRKPDGLALAKRQVVGTLRLVNLDPEAISAFVPALKVVRGKISAAFDVRGTVSDPQLGGEMRWRKGELVVMQDPHDGEGGARQREGNERGPDGKSDASSRPELDKGRATAQGVATEAGRKSHE
jgi:translocation and assembly module TamB